MFLIDPPPVLGVAEYDNTTGYLTYTPFTNIHGQDFVYYNACDSRNLCSSVRGEVVVTVQEVNDPPVALDFLHVGREDDFDLVGFFDNITDIETITDNLRIRIRDPATGDYLVEWTTQTGALLRVYDAHQVVTYRPLSTTSDRTPLSTRCVTPVTRGEMLNSGGWIQSLAA